MKEILVKTSNIWSFPDLTRGRKRIRLKALHPHHNETEFKDIEGIKEDKYKEPKETDALIKNTDHLFS